MLNPETNSNHRQSSTFMETLQDKLKDIKNFSNWSAKEQMVAVTAVGVIFGALLPIVAVALPVAATGAAAALTLFFAVQAVEYGYKGLKWSAEKTWEGAKYTADKIKAGAVYAKDSVKKGYENSVDSLKRGAHLVNKRTKEKVSDMAYSTAGALYRASGKEDYLDKITRFTLEEIKKSDEIKNGMKGIFADKGDNTGLVKDILSGISSKIDLKIAEEAKSGWMEHTPKWQEQKEFISNLNKKSLRSLLTQRSLPKDSYFIDSVFSEHYDEIKEVIAKCKEDHILKGSLELRSNMFKEGSAKPSKSFPLPSFSSLGRKSPTKSEGGETKGSGLEVLDNIATVDPTRLRRNSFDGPPVLNPVAPPKAPGSPTSSRDSGINSPNPSGSSTPTTKSVFFDDTKFKEKLEKRRASVDQPSVEPVNPGVVYNK